ncbi:MAG: hypothetical protein CMJ66_10515 [Planctomycetaceae bacterium]|nr:hypothetical protein [Planctomycetaceae bacterium]
MDTSSGIVRVPELDSTATTSLVLSRWFAEKCWYLVLQILDLFYSQCFRFTTVFVSCVCSDTQ